MGIPTSCGDDDASPLIDKAKCSGCGRCAQICPGDIIRNVGGVIEVNAAAGFGCIGCGHCALICPNQCISIIGRRFKECSLQPMASWGDTPSKEQLEALFLKRRSIRNFSGEQVSGDDLAYIQRMAASAPMGIPPWEVGVCVYDTPAKVRDLAHETVSCYQKMLTTFDNPLARSLVFILGRRSFYKQLTKFYIPLAKSIVSSAAKGQDVVLYDAPAALLFYCSPFADPADAYIACSYASIAAEALGLGTCMIGCVAPIIQRYGNVTAKQGIPAGHKPAIVLIIGHKKHTFERTIRRSFLCQPQK